LDLSRTGGNGFFAVVQELAGEKEMGIALHRECSKDLGLRIPPDAVV
jgi:hypothetical protein